MPHVQVLRHSWRHVLGEVQDQLVLRELAEPLTGEQADDDDLGCRGDD